MTMLKWITKDTNINFMGARHFTYALSSLLVILSLPVCISKVLTLVSISLAAY